MTNAIKSLSLFLLILGVVLSIGACGEESLPYEDIQEVPIPSANRPPLPETETETESTPESNTETQPTPPDENENESESNPEEETPTYQVGYYTLSDEDSLLYAQVWKDPDTLLASFAHDHVLRAAEWTGTIVYNPGDLSQCSITFSLPVEELHNDEQAMRDFVGLSGSVSDSDRVEIHENMLSSDQLNESSFPTIEFASTSCSGAGGLSGEMQVTGGLTIRGVTKSFTLPVDFLVAEGQIYATGVFEFTHSDFSFSPYSAFAGAVKNSQRLKMAFDVVGNSN